MRKVVFAVLLCAAPAFAGFERRGAGARTLALANAGAALGHGALAPTINPACLTLVGGPQVEVYYTPQPFGIKELSTGGIALGFRTAPGAVAVGLSSFGFDHYREVSGSLAVAGTISAISAGVTLNLYSVTIQHYGSAGAVALDVGTRIPIGGTAAIGMSLLNVGAATIGSSRERIPQALTVGCAYAPLRSFRLVFDYQKELSFEGSARIGFEYQPLDALILRGGASENPSVAAGGIGVRLLSFEFDYALSNHAELGWTQALSLSLTWGGRHENGD